MAAQALKIEPVANADASWVKHFTASGMKLAMSRNI
jgi:hypothetical protein